MMIKKITEIGDELSTLIKQIELIAIWLIDLIAHISFVGSCYIKTNAWNGALDEW